MIKDRFAEDAASKDQKKLTVEVINIISSTMNSARESTRIKNYKYDI